MNIQAEELMKASLQKYREIEMLTAAAWKDETGELLCRILNEECINIENRIRTCEAEVND